MMKRRTLLIVLFLLLFISRNDSALAFFFSNKKKKKTKKILNQEKCPNLAHFNYQIILALSTFPPQTTTTCTEKEEMDISASLQDTIDFVVNSLPRTIQTKNKICNNPINHRRHRRHLSSELALQQNTTRMLRRRRSYIYVGGGKCRYCLNDNFDHRQRALLPTIGAELVMNEHNPSSFTRDKKKEKNRDLMYLSFPKPPNPLPKVADISLCHKLNPYVLLFPPPRNIKNLQNPSSDTTMKWTNPKRTKINSKEALGPYVPGDSFGVQFDPNFISDLSNLMIQQILAGLTGDNTMIKQPVKEGIVRFTLHVLDLPTDVATGILADDPLYLFINGLKLDLNLLMSQSGIKKTNTAKYTGQRGSSFAGIKWDIRRMKGKHHHHAEYLISFTAPLVVFVHKNQLDLDFIFKPTAKAKRYIVQDLTASFAAAECEVTGLENSPFEDFKSVAESRLFHKLGKDLARKYQGKKGHCLYDKIPVVDVHLVEKQDWKETKPQCT